MLFEYTGGFCEEQKVLENKRDRNRTDTARDRSEDARDFRARRFGIANDLPSRFACPRVDKHDAMLQHFWLQESRLPRARDDDVRFFGQFAEPFYFPADHGYMRVIVAKKKFGRRTHKPSVPDNKHVFSCDGNRISF